MTDPRTNEGVEEGKEDEKKFENATEGVKGEEVIKKEEVEEEEEVKGKTLDEFFAERKVTTFKKEARKAEEIKKTNIEKGAEKEKVTTITKNLKEQDLYAVGATRSQDNVLLGF